MRTSLFCSFVVTSLVVAAGCSSSDTSSSAADSNLTSNEVTLTDFEFDGELVASDAEAVPRKIKAQMFYFVGILFPDNANARLDYATISNTTTAAEPGGLTLFKYHARIPVAWPKGKAIPAAYELKIPRRMDEEGQSAFYDKYNKACKGDEDEGRDDYWHDYRPANDGCKIDAADLVITTATVTKSPLNTDGVFPEYDKVWSDGALNIVAVFGKDSIGATSNTDIGINEFNIFVEAMRKAIPAVKTTPIKVPRNPGAKVDDVTLEGTLADGGKVKAVALLIDSARDTDSRFDQRFAEVTADADFVAYNGHSGLSKNTRAIAKKGTMVKGQYQIWFFNGCNSYAYLDDTLYQRRAAANAPDDPQGTKFMDVVGNVMPAFFGTIGRSDVTILKALMNRAQPKTYQQIFAGIPSDQEIVVEGEEDNTFKP